MEWMTIGKICLQSSFLLAFKPLLTNVVDDG